MMRLLQTEYANGPYRQASLRLQSWICGRPALTDAPAKWPRQSAAARCRVCLNLADWFADAREWRTARIACEISRVGIEDWRHHGSFATQAGQISPNKAVCDQRHMLKCMLMIGKPIFINMYFTSASV